jgi:uncharacterized membrane protein YfcA
MNRRDSLFSVNKGPRFWLLLALIGLIGGALSGAFGIGGGIIMVPLLVWLARLDQRTAAGGE